MGEFWSAITEKLPDSNTYFSIYGRMSPPYMCTAHSVNKESKSYSVSLRLPCGSPIVTLSCPHSRAHSIVREVSLRCTISRKPPSSTKSPLPRLPKCNTTLRSDAFFVCFSINRNCRMLLLPELFPPKSPVTRPSGRLSSFQTLKLESFSRFSIVRPPISSPATSSKGIRSESDDQGHRGSRWHHSEAVVSWYRPGQALPQVVPYLPTPITRSTLVNGS